MLVVMEKFTYAKTLSQSLKTNNEKLIKAVTFLSGYNGKFQCYQEKKIISFSYQCLKALNTTY